MAKKAEGDKNYQNYFINKAFTLMILCNSLMISTIRQKKQKNKKKIFINYLTLKKSQQY